MLRCSLRYLQRAALQWQQACSASAGIAAAQGEALPLAAAMQRLALHQEPSWAAGGSRGFSAAAGGGGEQTPAAAGDGSAQPPAAPQGEGRSSAAAFVSESGRLEFQDYEEALEAWGKAMDDGAAAASGCFFARQLLPFCHAFHPASWRQSRRAHATTSSQACPSRPRAPPTLHPPSPALQATGTRPGTFSRGWRPWRTDRSPPWRPCLLGTPTPSRRSDGESTRPASR